MAGVKTLQGDGGEGLPKWSSLSEWLWPGKQQVIKKVKIDKR